MYERWSKAQKMRIAAPGEVEKGTGASAAASELGKRCCPLRVCRSAHAPYTADGCVLPHLASDSGSFSEASSCGWEP